MVTEREQWRSELDELYRLAFYHKLVDSKSQFAELIDVKQQALSCAMSGDIKYMTEPIIEKARKAVSEKLADMGINTDSIKLNIPNESSCHEESLKETIERLQVINIQLETQVKQYKAMYEMLLDKILSQTKNEITL